MRNTKIIADSTCDLSKEQLDTYDITVIPLFIQLDSKSYLDKVEITPPEIFAWSDQNGRTPKTAAPGIDIVQGALEKFNKEDTDLIFFGISEDMSTTCNVVRLVAEEMGYENMHVINSMNLSTGIGLQILRAAELAAKGWCAEDIVRHIEEIRSKVRASFVIDTLVYLHRGGRCSAMTALVAGALKLKPRIAVTDGKMDVSKKYRGNISTVIKKYVTDMEEDLRKADNTRVFITHSGCSDEIVKQVYDYLVSLGHFKEIDVTVAGSVISSHCGPNTLGVLFYEAL